MKKKIITDPRGQWAHPGKPTRIPSNDITMQGVPFPVMAYPNFGEPVLMQPGGEYYFPQADYVDEYPIVRKGGSIKRYPSLPNKKDTKRYSKSLMATNKLFTQHPLLARPRRNKIYDPNSKYFQPGGQTDAMNAMMKARLAYANEFGNPAAKRMIVAPDNPYDFGNGMTGTHYMSSMDNYAVPQIQDENGQLTLGDYGPDSNEAIRFDRPEDAEYFAEHYKNISPAFIETELSPEEIEEYRKGGYIVKDISVAPLNKFTYQDGGQNGCPRGEMRDPNTGNCVPIDVKNLEEQTIYGNEGKRKMQGNLFDKLEQAKNAYNNYRTQLGLDKQRQSTEGRSSIGSLKEQIASYKAELEKEKKVFDRATKALNVLKAKDSDNWKNAKVKDVLSAQGVDALRSLYKDNKISDATFRDFYETYGKRYDKNVMKEGYKGQYQDAANEAMQRKTEGYNTLINTADELSGLAGARRVAEDPLGTLKGVSQTAGDLVTLPLGLAKGAYNYATEGNFDMSKNVLTGSNYGEGFDETMDVLGTAGLFAPGVSLLKGAGLGSKALTGAKSAGNFVKGIPKQLSNLSKFDDAASVASKAGSRGSGTLNAGISPDLIKNAVGPNNKVAATVLDKLYFDPILNKTLNKVSPLNLIPGYGKKLEGAVKPLGNVLNKNIKNGNLIEQQGIIGKAKNLVGKGSLDDITTKMNKSNADIYSATFDDAAANSDIAFGDPLKQAFISRTFNKSNATTPLMSKTTGAPLKEINLSDAGVSLNRRLPFSNRYVPIDKQKLMNNQFQWSTAGAGAQNLAEKAVKSVPAFGLIGGAGAALTYDPLQATLNTIENPEDQEAFLEEMKRQNLTIDDIDDKATRWDSFKQGFSDFTSSPTEFISNPDPYGIKFYGSLLGVGSDEKKKGGQQNNYIEAELTDKEIRELKKQGYKVVII